MTRPWIIYGLMDPRSHIRYVGFTFGAARERLRRHISDSVRVAPNARNSKAAWIRGLMRRKLKPGIVVLEEGEGEGYCSAERFWIGLLGRSGARLVNSKTGPKRRRILRRRP